MNIFTEIAAVTLAASSFNGNAPPRDGAAGGPDDQDHLASTRQPLVAFHSWASNATRQRPTTPSLVPCND